MKYRPTFIAVDGSIWHHETIFVLLQCVFKIVCEYDGLSYAETRRSI
jgi:hypothetical protein